MADKEAKARIKINKLLEEAGWRFFDDESGSANISLENNVKITKKLVDEFGENFEKTKNGFIDFLLLDDKGFPIIVLEAKSEDKNPLVGKEQARKYAKAQNCRFVILSNGNLHYFWDLNHGNPYVITKFPHPSSVKIYKDHQPNPQKLIEERVLDEYIVLTQLPNYFDNPSFKNETLRKDFVEQNKLKFLRPYQLRAVDKLQNAVKEGSNRFLFEMATGTGKTLVAAAVIKLFLRTGNAKRVLFLVDRLMLNVALRGDGTLPENQAAYLTTFGDFLKTCGEGIYGSRAWKIFGEGPLKMKDGRQEENHKDFTQEDIRFTTKAGNLYAFVLAPPTKDIVIKTLATGGLLKNELESIALLGSSETVKWSRSPKGLAIKRPETLPCKHVIGFRITLK